MWLPKTNLRKLVVLPALLLGAMALASCSLTPLYGEQSDKVSNLELTYEVPTTRLEQIIYQDLALRLGKSTSPDANLVVVTVSKGSRRVGRTSNGSPATTYEQIVTATMRVTTAVKPVDSEVLDSEEVTEVKTIFTATHKASATYTTNGQTLTDRQAADDAAERAALAVAQILRLDLSATLTTK